MPHQSAKNHGRYIPLWHYIVPLLLLLLIVGSVMALLHADRQTHYVAVCIFIIALILPLLYWYARWFALRAQDRAIRAEENFRHFILTGKPLDRQLRMRQIIALRFASDEELPGLARRAVDEKLETRQIKDMIKHWKTDHNRV
jgi:hypothetical protein